MNMTKATTITLLGFGAQAPPSVRTLKLGDRL